MLNRPARGKTRPTRDNEHALSEEKALKTEKWCFPSWVQCTFQLPTRMMRCDWSLLRATLKLTFNTFPEFFQLSHKAKQCGISQLKISEFYEPPGNGHSKVQLSPHRASAGWEFQLFFSHFFPLSNGLKSRLLPGCWERIWKVSKMKMTCFPLFSHFPGSGVAGGGGKV